jgi:hypothetical protein
MVFERSLKMNAAITAIIERPNRYQSSGSSLMKGGSCTIQEVNTAIPNQKPITKSQFTVLIVVFLNTHHPFNCSDVFSICPFHS